MLRLRKSELNTPLSQNSLEDGHTKVSSAKTFHSWLTWTSKHRRLKSSCPSLLVDIKREASKKWTAQLLSASSTPSWWRVETVVRSNWQSEPWSKPWKSFIFKPVWTPSKFSSTPSLTVVPEKTQPESVLVVSLEDKLSTSHLSEEWTKPFTSWLEAAENPLSEASRPLVRFLLMKLSLLQR